MIDLIESNFTPIPNLSIDEFVHFMEKVEKTATCWLWTASKGPCGYGRFNLLGKQIPAHRISWRWFKKEDPGSKRVLHTCSVRACVNPDHLFLGTHSENMLQAYSEGTRSCKGGLHPRSKLTEPEVLEIRKLAKSGLSRTLISKRFPGVDITTIRDVIARRTWSHL